MIVKIIVALCTGTLWMFWNWSFKTTMPIPVIFYRNKKRLLLFDYLGVVSLYLADIGEHQSALQLL